MGSTRQSMERFGYQTGMISGRECVSSLTVEATKTELVHKFCWPELQNEGIDFCKKCLHCIGSLDA
jgi:hypothetical protein